MNRLPASMLVQYWLMTLFHDELGTKQPRPRCALWLAASVPPQCHNQLRWELLGQRPVNFFMFARNQHATAKRAAWSVAGKNENELKIEILENFGDPYQVKNEIQRGSRLCNGWLPRSVSSRSSLAAFGGNSGRKLQMKPSTSRNSIAEDLLTLRNASNFPAELLFTDPDGYKEVEIVFQRPRCIHAISFLTTGDDRQFDPLCWEIDGSIDGKTWMRLQTQSCEFETPATRRRAINTFFVTEPWCKPGTPGAPSSGSRVDLQKIPAEVSERLCFFASSLRAILKQGQGAGCASPVRAGRDTLLDRKIGGVPTLTQVVPVYEEQVILTEEFLCASDGRNTNLGFVISQDAWLH